MAPPAPAKLFKVLEQEGGVDHEIILGEKVPSGYVPGQAEAAFPKGGLMGCTLLRYCWQMS